MVSVELPVIFAGSSTDNNRREHMLTPVSVLVNPSPYGDVVPQEDFVEIARRVVRKVGGQIMSMRNASEVEKPVFAFALFDPTQPPWMLEYSSWIIAAAYGDDGSRLLPNGLDKGMQTVRFGEEWGKVLYTQPHRIPPGAFRWGFAGMVDGTPGGGSGFSEMQDKRVVYEAASEYNYQIAMAFDRWNAAHPRKRADGKSHSWFTDDGNPPLMVSDPAFIGTHTAKVLEMQLDIDA
jgi:hypothetical protein